MAWALVRPAGLIPAWAGKTTNARPANRSPAAHPRVGGENLDLDDNMRTALGSSPRGRGKLPDAGDRIIESRLIPAWAGKTETAPLRAIRCTAHPRVGGENAGQPCRSLTIRGSSPRGRGKPAQLAEEAGVTRLIPAWAGKTLQPPDRRHIPGAHPRVGGENPDGGKYTAGRSGSSPRGRGKHQKRIPGIGHAGLIPAWAGKTPPGRRTAARSRAHPRVGGENEHADYDARLRKGSSPRGRGKLINGISSMFGSGLIPAWAGKTPPT